MKHKKAIIISIASVLLVLVLYNVFKPPAQNNLWNNNQMMQRSSGTRRNSSNVQSTLETVSGIYYGSSASNNSENTAQSMNQSDMMQGNSGTNTQQQSISDRITDAVVGEAMDEFNNDTIVASETAHDWWILVEKYNTAADYINKQYAGKKLSICDAVYDFEIDPKVYGLFPYVVFERNGMKAYMYFMPGDEDEIAKLTKAMPKTITGYDAVFERDRMYLFYCRLGF